MKINAYLIAIATILAVVFLATPGTCEDTEPIDMALKYEVMIDNAITKCLAKGRHLDSRSPNLRRAAVISCLKAGYLMGHKKELTVYLSDAKAVPSSGIVQYHLNKKFYEAFRPNEIYALLGANQIPSKWRASQHATPDRNTE
jgi:hypothetical protein